MLSTVRGRGFLLLGTGLLVGLGMHLFSEWLNQFFGSKQGSPDFGIVFPVVLVLTGLIQVVTNSPFSEMEQWWMSLKSWQRGVTVVGVVVILLTLLALFMIVGNSSGWI